MRQRKLVLKGFWKDELKKLKKKLPKKFSESYPEKLAELEKLELIPEQVSDAVIEKYLTYVKNDNLN